MTNSKAEMQAKPLSIGVELARQSFRSGRVLADLGSSRLVLGDGGLFLVVRRGDGNIVLMVGPAFGGDVQVVRGRRDGGIFRTPVGTLDIHVREHGPSLIQVTTDLTPSSDFKFPKLPRDLYILSSSGEPIEIEPYAAQRGLNAGIIYGGDKSIGNLFYFQNFSDTQPFFVTTETTPDNVVGGQGTELGYGPPSSETHPLPGGTPTRIYSTWLCLGDHVGMDSQSLGNQFLNLFGQVYRAIEKPPLTYRDWPSRARKTLQNLARVKDATRRDFGQLYIRPYLAAEVPDSMTQMSVITSLLEYARWRKRPVALADRLSAGMGRFYRKDFCAVHRYLPNVVSEKDENEIDSWYLYHPLLNLGICAQFGETWAEELFRESLDYGIRSAHHFDYRWPIQYDGRDFSIIEATRGEQNLGQTDVGGVYAYVMLKAYELYQDTRYLEEAKRAIVALKDYAFDLLYQSNLSAFGAVASVRLARLTDDQVFHDQIGSFMATLIHNSVVWESQLNLAENYSTFLGVSCLHDGPYMAAYECFECFAALRTVVAEGAALISDDVALFAGESSRYAIDRSWSFYPDQFQEDALATEIRNGYIDRNLSFPLEDLYADGRNPGEVGQEIYGAGAPFKITSSAYQRMPDGSMLYCSMPFVAKEKDRSIEIRIYGSAESPAELRLWTKGGSARKVSVEGTAVSGEITVPAGAMYTIDLK